MRAIKTIFVLFIALCILSFSGGVNIVKHYCGDTLKQITLNKESVKCCDKHEPTSNTDLIKETCCLDQTSFFKTFDFEKETKTAVLTFYTPTLDNKTTNVEEHLNVLPIDNYSLPPPKLAIFKRVQRFLI